MKYLIIICILILLIMILITAFDDDSDIQDLKDENILLNEKNVDLTFKVLAAGNEAAAAQQRISVLEQELKDALASGAPELNNPTWEELRRFVEADNTDKQEYILNEFDCEGFAITLRDNAWHRGFRSAYVSIGFDQGETGHTLNAFQTTDKGFVFVDNTKRDCVGYLEIGHIYGTIDLAQVKENIIDCPASPDQFWHPIEFIDFKGNIFDYSYYVDFASREQFYRQSLALYNDGVNNYNRAVNDFSQGSRDYNQDELDSWSKKLEAWADNLEQLLDKLGAVRTGSDVVVKTIEIYWN